MIDYEYLILNNSDTDNTTDECKSCPYKGRECNNQCLQVEAVYNPYINSQISNQFWIMRNQLEVVKMEYRNNYVTAKQSVIFNIAIYIKKHFSYKAGTALLKMFC